MTSLLWGLGFLVIGLPLRLGVVAIHRRFALGESFGDALRISMPMLPTLVFTLVIAVILRDQFDALAYLAGGLIVCAIVNTLIPSVPLHAPAPDFESPHPPPLEVENSPGP